jgi:hypothetical protein
VRYVENLYRKEQLGGVLRRITDLPATAPMAMLKGHGMIRRPVGRGSGLRREVGRNEVTEVMDPVCVGIVEGVWRGFAAAGS